jgi:hypothetical protein
MDMQHIENLFRRFKGEFVNIKSVSGGIYEGRVYEVTDDYVALVERENTEAAQVFVFFHSIESMMPVEVSMK